MNIKLVKTNVFDCAFSIFRNNNEVRKYSINNKTINQNKHKLWFKISLERKNYKVFTIKYNNINVGYVRSKKVDKNYEVSIALLKSYMSKGIGKIA